MKRGWIASLVAAALVLPMAARGADETKTPESTPTVKTPGTTPDTSTTKTTKGRLPQYYAKLPVTEDQRHKIYEIEATFAPKIKALHEQLEALETEQSEQFKGVLTPDQQDKLKAMKAEANGKRKGKGSTDAKTPDTKPADSAKSNAPSSATPAPASK